MSFDSCRQIPAAAWQQLHGAKWPRLKKANFAWCLARERNGYRIRCLCVLSTVPASIYLVWNMSPSSRVNVSLFFGKLLYDLTLDHQCRCFLYQGEGAADLLEALGRSQELEAVEFNFCSKIPAAAWQQLRGAKWLKLKKVDFTTSLARERNG